jgi:ferredoxin
MTIPSERTQELGSIIHTVELCTNCGLCADVCPGGPLQMQDNKLRIDPQRWFGCIACGHCVAICPHDAIKVTGRTLHEKDFIALPEEGTAASFIQLKNLGLKRRSIRHFRQQEIEWEKVQKILQLARSAPMGIPPSDVKVLVLHGKHKVKVFADNFFQEINRRKLFFHPLVLKLLRPLMGQATYALMQDFVAPLVKLLRQEKAQGKDYLLYNAPLAFYYYRSPYADVADPIIAATYAMLAAESLGLGSCLIGTIAPMIHRWPKFRDKWSIGKTDKEGIMLIVGYPKYQFQKAILRTFNQERVLN